MQPIDAVTLKHLAADLDIKLAGGRIQRIQQANYHDLLLHVFVGGDAMVQKLFMSIHPNHPFCTVVDDADFLSFPKHPMNLCLQLRKHLSSAKIQQITTLPNERVLRITLDNYNDIGQHCHWILFLELMGKHSNLVLVNAEDNRVVACAHGVSEGMSRVREIHVDVPYAPPPEPNKPLLSSLMLIGFQQEWQRYLDQKLSEDDTPGRFFTTHFAGVSRAMLDDVFAATHTPEEAYALLQTVIQGTSITPGLCLDNERFTLVTPKGGKDWKSYHSVTSLIADYGLWHYQKQQFQQLKSSLSAVLKSQYKKLNTRLNDIEQALETDKKTDYKHLGDLLTLAISMPHKMESVDDDNTTVHMVDPVTEQSVVIPISAKKSLQENAQYYYRQYKKATTRQRMNQETLADLQPQREFVETLQDAVAHAESLNELRAVEDDMVFQGWVKPSQSGLTKKQRDKQASMPSFTESSDGFRIYVGRSGLQNETIVSELAHGHDVWLHTHNIPGAHVLIKTNKQLDIPSKTLEEAAQLAVYYSQARHAVNVPVIYTLAKFIRKIPNSYPGHVTYKNEQAVNVTAEREHLMELLQQMTVVH